MQLKEGCLGTPENLWPDWAILKSDDVAEACWVAEDMVKPWSNAAEDEARFKRKEELFYTEFLPALVAVVRKIEQILRAADREDTDGFFAENILYIKDGHIFLRVFTCVNGNCHVPAEGPLGQGVRDINEMGWGNLDFDFGRG